VRDTDRRSLCRFDTSRSDERVVDLHINADDRHRQHPYDDGRTAYDNRRAAEVFIGGSATNDDALRTSLVCDPLRFNGPAVPFRGNEGPQNKIMRSISSEELIPCLRRKKGRGER
jgi:hypothetical protein